MAKKPMEWQNKTHMRSGSSVIVGAKQFSVASPKIQTEIDAISRSILKNRKQLEKAKKDGDVLKCIKLERMIFQKALQIHRLQERNAAIDKREVEKAKDPKPKDSHGRRIYYPHSKTDFRRKLHDPEMPDLPEKLEIGMIIVPGKTSRK